MATKIYYSSLNGDNVDLARLPAGLPVLASFAYHRELAWTINHFDDVLVDSGAFTAATTGKTIDLSAYIRFVKERKPRHFLALDVIGNPAGTRKNFETMLNAGVVPMPVLHAFMSEEEVGYYCSHAPYVALGGYVTNALGQRASARNKAQTLAAWKRAWFAHRERNKFHGLGVTSKQFTDEMFASVDSSSWSYGARQGMLLIPGTVDFVWWSEFATHVGHRSWLMAQPPEIIELFERFCAEWGFTFDELKTSAVARNTWNVLGFEHVVKTLPQTQLEVPHGLF